MASQTVYNGRTLAVESGFIEGWELCVAKLADLKKTVAKRAINRGARAGAKIIQEIAIRNAPRSKNKKAHPYGTLVSNIKVRALKRSRVWTGVSVQLTLYYAAFLELGTKRGILARHFLQNAVKAGHSRAMATAIETIWNDIATL